MIGKWLNTFGWGGLYVAVGIWLLVAVVLEAAASRKTRQPHPWLILLVGYVVCARMYVHYFLNQNLEPMTDWKTYGSQFTGWFLWLGISVAGVSTVLAMHTLLVERRVVGATLTAARFIVLSAFLLLACNTMYFPIRQVRGIPNEVKQELQEEARE